VEAVVPFDVAGTPLGQVHVLGTQSKLVVGEPWVAPAGQEMVPVLAA